MRKVLIFVARLGAVLALLAAAASCAPTMRSTQGSAETFQNTSEASTDLSLSTSPRSSSFQEAQKTARFVEVNFDRVRTDMAVGGGEHLSSLATLMGIPEERHARFFALTKDRFDVLFTSEKTTHKELLSRLYREVSENPGLTEP